MKEDLPIKTFHKIFSKTVIVHYGRFFVALLIAFSCNSRQELLDQKEYEGPMTRLDSINTLISDSAKVILHQMAPIEESFANGDREWKEGLFLEYMDEFGDVSSTFISDYAFYEKKEHLYKGVGNVIVQNATTGDELNTEELFWDPRKKEFYTERFVTITTEDEIHTGEGLTANEDFSMYKILKPEGIFAIEEGMNPTTPTTAKKKTLSDETN